jgi:hypothetical protein
MTRRQAAPTDAELDALANELRGAVTTFEDTLPQDLGMVVTGQNSHLRGGSHSVGFADWPPWSNSLCGPGLVPELRGPRHVIDPDFQPCRRCLTTGMRLATLLGS